MKDFLDLKVSFDDMSCEICENCVNKDYHDCEEITYTCFLEDVYYFKINTNNWCNEIYNAYVTISYNVDESYYLGKDMTVGEFLNENKEIKTITIDNEVDQYEIEVKDIINFYNMDYISELISKQNRQLKRNELAEIIAEDGQPIRALYNYMSEAFDLLDGFTVERILKLKFENYNPIIESEELHGWNYEDYVNGLLEVTNLMLNDLNENNEW